MSRVNRGDENTKPNNEFSDAAEMAIASRDAINKADEKMMEIDVMVKGRSQDQIVNLT
jgi:hypothetical protein